MKGIQRTIEANGGKTCKVKLELKLNSPQIFKYTQGRGMLQIPKMTQFVILAQKLANNLNICLDVSQTKIYNTATYNEKVT